MDAPIIRTSAPGKLFLFGEYGVLAGGTCVVAAVGRRVFAERREQPSGYKALGASLDDATALPEAVLAELTRADATANKCDRSVSHLSTDIRQLYATDAKGRGDKLGLGSSAASVVALTAACLIEKGSESVSEAVRDQIFARSLAAHRQLQGGRGSGADVAASSFGGIISYRLLDPAEPFSGLLQAEAFEDDNSSHPGASVRAGLALPDGLRVEPVWLGRPARSTSFVRLCEQALSDAPAPTSRALARTAELAQAAMDALLAGDAPRVVELVEQADRALEALGEAIEAPIVTEGHRGLREAASGTGICVKPSGAGGGDFSLAVGSAEAEWERFLARLPETCRHIPLEFGVDGARLDA